MNFGELIQQITPGNWGIIVTLLVMGGGWFLKQWREERKFTAEERLAKREGFQSQVDLLMRELSECRQECRLQLTDQHNLRKEYDEFRRLSYKIEEQHRTEVSTLQVEVEGLKRKVEDAARHIATLESKV